LTGCKKVIAIRRRILDKNKKEKEDFHTIKVNVTPGATSTIRFSRQGNQQLNRIPGDVLCNITAIPHEKFKRAMNGFDLECTVTITESQAEKSRIAIPLLGEPPKFFIFENINSILSWRIPNKGLPILNKSAVRGDLVVKFEIIQDIVKKAPSADD